MSKLDTDSYKILESYIAKTNNTYALTDGTSIEAFEMLLEVVKSMGLDPMKTEELRKGMVSLFNIEVSNLPDLENTRFIFTPNHVSDLDALILGLLHPKIRIVSKTDWTENKKVMPFLSAHYDLKGLDRSSLQSLRHVLADAINYFNESDENRHYLIFSQGTISDFNRNSFERISTFAQRLSRKTDVPIVNIFIEQVSINHPTRIVFDEPMRLTPKDDFRRIWLEREAALQNALFPPARLPKLSHKHSNNNKPSDPFF